MTLTLTLTAELESRLIQAATAQGVPVEQYALHLLEQVLLPKDRSQAIASLWQSWIDDDEAIEQQETGDFLIRVLDEDRPSDRKLFPTDLKGVTW